MNLLPQGFDLDGPTWFYLSLLLIVAVFFRFHRLWSLRNVDLGLLLAISPGLILIDRGRAAAGEYVLVTVTAVLLVRLLLDSLLTRRPHTTQNLNPAGLTFLCAATFLVLSLFALEEARETAGVQSASVQQQAEAMVNRTAIPPQTVMARTGPPTHPDNVGNGQTPVVITASMKVAAGHIAPPIQEKLPEIMALIAHLAVIAGLLLVGRNLFGDLQLGTAMATLYMLIPCTAIDVGAFLHVLPSALIVWAIVAWQRPVVSGVLLGLACGTLVFPVFLVPVWVAFYGRRGGLRFVASLAVVTIALLSTYALTSADPVVFWKQAVTTIKLPLHALLGEDMAVSSLTDVSALHRIPFVAAFFILLATLTLWPRKKTVEHLIAQSAALVVGTQFWYTQPIGVYLIWALPLLLIVVFRPRIAQLSQNRRRPIRADVTTAPAPQPALAVPSTRVKAGTALERATLFR